jgi:hypothetical protein
MLDAADAISAASLCFCVHSRSDLMAQNLKPGDEVEWDSSGGHSKGKVVKKATSPMQIKGHKVAASPDNPEYVVRSDKTGAEAAHKPQSLRKSR